MSNSLKELLAQREALETKIAELRASELTETIAKVRALIDEFGLTSEDVFPRTSSSRKTTKTSAKVAAKYRDPASGKEWSGRGLAPKWIAGRNKADFLIA